MRTIPANYLQALRLSVAWQPDLPAGIRQSDCDGPANDLAEADGDFLWNACDERQQELVSARFLQVNLERLRDALLDSQDGFVSLVVSPDGESAASLGRIFWTLWISYRDRVLREMARRGDLSSI
jgi:hypothetical protein